MDESQLPEELRLKPGQVRIHFKRGETQIIPQLNLQNTIRMLGNEAKNRGEADRDGATIATIDYYKPPETVTATTESTAPPPVPVKDKSLLLGDIYKDNKITANELIEWIEKSDSIEDIGIVMKDETRKSVKAAAREKIDNLL